MCSNERFAQQVREFAESLAEFKAAFWRDQSRLNEVFDRALAEAADQDT